MTSLAQYGNVITLCSRVHSSVHEPSAKHQFVSNNNKTTCVFVFDERLLCRLLVGLYGWDAPNAPSKGHAAEIRLKTLIVPRRWQIQKTHILASELRAVAVENVKKIVWEGQNREIVEYVLCYNN